VDDYFIHTETLFLASKSEDFKAFRKFVKVTQNKNIGNKILED